MISLKLIFSWYSNVVQRETILVFVPPFQQLAGGMSDRGPGALLPHCNTFLLNNLCNIPSNPRKIYIWFTCKLLTNLAPPHLDYLGVGGAVRPDGLVAHLGTTSHSVATQSWTGF